MTARVGPLWGVLLLRIPRFRVHMKVPCSLKLPHLAWQARLKAEKTRKNAADLSLLRPRKRLRPGVQADRFEKVIEVLFLQTPLAAAARVSGSGPQVSGYCPLELVR